jgi:glutamate racemase
LSVLKAIWKGQVADHAIFLADYAINPLGVRSDAALAEVVSSWLERAAGVSDTLVIACNTLSIRYEQIFTAGTTDNLGLNVVSMVDCFEAMVRSEVDILENRKILVIGTAFTARQPLYAQVVERVLPGAWVDTMAATALERKIARFEDWSGVEDSALTAELKTAIGDADVAILACTCFPMVKADLETLFPDVVFLDPGAYCSELITGHRKARQKRLSLEVTGNEVPAAKVISFARSYLDENSIDLYGSH